MLSQQILSGVKNLRIVARRNFGIAVPAMQKTNDPIQQLFLSKIREYKEKSKDGKLVDSNPEVERELKNELERVSKQYGGGQGVDMTQFPEFKFTEPKIDPIDTTV